jgi:hypothetical protein
MEFSYEVIDYINQLEKLKELDDYGLTTITCIKKDTTKYICNLCGDTVFEIDNEKHSKMFRHIPSQPFIYYKLELLEDHKNLCKEKQMIEKIKRALAWMEHAKALDEDKQSYNGEYDKYIISCIELIDDYEHEQYKKKYGKNLFD